MVTDRPDGAGKRELERGRALFESGQILDAREQFLAAMRYDPSLVLLELARTFDPHYVNDVPDPDSDPEPKRALTLYLEAVKLGSTAASADLDRLRQRHPDLR